LGGDEEKEFFVTALRHIIRVIESATGPINSKNYVTEEKIERIGDPK
jgi:hypothetical protein